MSGPRVTSGDASMQDGSTPVELMEAVARRFGPVQFDLAAHRGNKKHARYFAAAVFVEKYELGKTDLNALGVQLCRRGADSGEVARALETALAGPKKGKISVKNHDPDPAAFDALAQDWAPLTLADPYCGVGNNLLWLNCEWADVTTWATKCAAEAKMGANVLLLTHVAIADWARDIIFGKADVSLLSGRLCFDGKNVLPKDCMLSHFHPGQSGRMEVWDWRRDAVTADWLLSGRGGRVVLQNPEAA